MATTIDAYSIIGNEFMFNGPYDEEIVPLNDDEYLEDIQHYDDSLGDGGDGAYEDFDSAHKFVEHYENM